MNIKLSQNRNIIAGSSIWLTACVFMLAVYATHDRVPLLIGMVYLFAIVVGGGLLTWGALEQRKLSKHRLSTNN
jgi:hypothetical protein